MPLIAQITGAFALLAAVAMPPFSDVPEASAVPPVAAAPPPLMVPPPPVEASAPSRPAHLNLDVRHSFKSVDLSVTVDGKRALTTRLSGSGRRFGVFGKRGERGFTRSLELEPGVRVVQVRLRSVEDKFDQTRVERFDLDSAAVAAMRITVDKGGLFVAADRPPAPERPAARLAQAPPPPPASHVVSAAPPARQASALGELYQSLRSVLIAVAGFVASAATGFVVQEFLRSRKGLMGL